MVESTILKVCGDEIEILCPVCGYWNTESSIESDEESPTLVLVYCDCPHSFLLCLKFLAFDFNNNLGLTCVKKLSSETFYKVGLVMIWQIEGKDIESTHFIENHYCDENGQQIIGELPYKGTCENCKKEYEGYFYFRP